LLSPEEKEILKSGEYYNRRGYYKFLRSKRVEKMNQDIEFLERKVVEPWLQLRLDVSDKYESMPTDFQKLITKMHPRLEDMMNFWEKFVIFREKADDPIDKIYEIVMTKIDIRCEICYTFLLTN